MQAPPITAPTGQVPVDPAIGARPGVSTATGSTAIPGWNHPPASWDVASELAQYASLPGRETNVLIQATGREWRVFRNGDLTQYGGWLLALVFSAIALLHLARGPIRLRGKPTGRTIERFSALERGIHWTLAGCFVTLAVTGAAFLWGKYLVLPWLGYRGYSWLLLSAKTLHNFVGPLFIVSLVFAFTLFVRDNAWRAYDLRWLVRMGGLFGHKGEVPSGRFNAGEKAWFWGGLVMLGLVVSATGLILDFPDMNQGRPTMLLADTLHLIAAVLFIAASLGHIYLGTLGMEGAYGAMRKGRVDEEWAREHHALWYRKVRGKRPSVGLSPGGR